MSAPRKVLWCTYCHVFDEHEPQVFTSKRGAEAWCRYWCGFCRVARYELTTSTRRRTSA